MNKSKGPSQSGKGNRITRIRKIPEGENADTSSDAQPAVIAGDEVHGDKVLGDKYVIGHVERLELTVPSPRPLAPLRTRIPEPRAAHLVGRTDELDWLCERLKAGDAAAIAGVRGIGGIGKTELAIAATRALEAHFEGRVIWLDCGPNDVYAIQERMAAALGAALESDDLQVRADVLALAFRGQPPTLVVLDDVRRHLADFALIAPPRPPCALLVTSRRSDLPLPDEVIWRIDVLSPDQSQELLSSLIPETWLAAEPWVAEDIAKLLEHIPLALTLAARRARRIAARRDASAQHPLTTLLDELRARRVQVLDQGADPQRPDLSVIITFDASYQDLDIEDQARLCKLGVFARSEFELSALQAVWGDDEKAARTALERLVNAGLVEEIGQDTWWMHDLLREYARDRLEAMPAEAEATRLAHAACWQSYLASVQLLGVEDWRSLEAHRPEVEQAAGWLLADWGRAPDLAAGLAIAISETFQPYTFPQWARWLAGGLAAAKSGDQRNTTRRLQRSLGEYYMIQGNVDQAEQLLRVSLVAANELLQDSATDDEVKAARDSVAVTQSSLAMFLITRGQYEEAEWLCRQSAQTFEALGDWSGAAMTQWRLAAILTAQGEYAEAERLYRESLTILEALEENQSTAMAQSGLADLLRTQGRYEEAEGLYHQSLQTLESRGDRRHMAMIQSSLADLLCVRGQYEEAEELYLQSVQALEALGDRRQVTVTQSSFATLLRIRGQYEKAEQLCRQNLQILETLGDRRGVAVTQCRLAGLLQIRGRYEEAEQIYRESLGIYRVLEDRLGEAVAQSSLADLLHTRGQDDEAEQLYRWSLQAKETLGDQRGIAVTQSGLADLLSTHGQYDEAERLYRGSLKVFEALGDSREVAVSQSRLAGLLVTRGDHQEAEWLYRQSLQTLEALGDQQQMAITQSGLADLLIGIRGEYDEATRLCQSGLAICRAIRDPQGVATFFMRLGVLAMAQGQNNEAFPLLQEARRGFEAIGLISRLAVIDQLLAKAQGNNVLTLDGLIVMVRAARRGDRQAGQQAWDICLDLAQSTDATQSALGRALQRLLAGDDPEPALAPLPEDLRKRFLEGLNDRA